jgi:hypothetical protein
VLLRRPGQPLQHSTRWRSGPSIGTTFPAAGARLNNTTYAAGCSTDTAGDICGATSDSATTAYTETDLDSDF